MDELAEGAHSFLGHAGRLQHASGMSLDGRGKARGQALVAWRKSIQHAVRSGSAIDKNGREDGESRRQVGVQI